MRAKKKRNLIIMLFFMCLLIGVLVVLTITGGEKQEEQKKGRKLSSFSALTLSKVSYQYEDSRAIRFALKDDAWVNEDDVNFPLSSTAFENGFVSAFFELEMGREMEDYENLADFGLDTPFLTVTLENNIGTKEEFYVGDYNSMLQQYYLQKKGDSNVYTVSGNLVYICRADVYDYATVESFPAYDTDTVTELTIVNDITKVKLAYFAEGHEADLYGLCKWFFKEPFTDYHAAETNKINDMTTNILDAVKFNKLVNYSANEEEIEAYGLKDAKKSYTISYVLKDEETEKETPCSKSVVFGNYNSEQDCYYARVVENKDGVETASKKVYVVAKSSAEALLGIDPLDYIYKNVIYLKLSDVAGGGDITIESEEGTYVLVNATEINEDGSDNGNFYYINDKSAPEEDVEGFYYNILAKNGVERLIYDKSTVTNKEPRYKMTYHLTEEKEYYGKDIVVTYTEYDMNYYQVSINGKTPDMLVNKRLMDETMKEFFEIPCED